jgi:glutamine amidotransferase
MSRVLIIDYSMGNIDSMKRALEECGASVVVGNSAEDFRNATHIVLPGVGSFPHGMEHIDRLNIPYLLREQILEKGIPLLGVCLGMQLFAMVGAEVHETTGLGLIPGKVLQLEPRIGERIPHIGWNSVIHDGSSALLEGIPSGKDFYFVHSYYFACENSTHIVATTDYCGGFASIINRGNIWGTQFHPEKSQRVGMQLLRNFLAFS